MGLRNVFCAAVAVLALPAAAAVYPPSGINPRLRAPLDEAPAFVLAGNGVHVYECRQSLVDSNAYVWSFVAPDATLYEGTRGVARMTTPNLLESTEDRSSVSGFPRSAVPAGPGNLPWTLMAARPVGDDGLFSGVTSIQRVNTNGGAAPRDGCNPDTAGNEVHVAYTADYYFYKKRGTS